MKKRITVTVILTLLILFIFSMPAMAGVYRYTSTSFRYIGDIFHEKIVEFGFDGGYAAFQITGEGEVAGRHDIHEKRYKESPADSVYRVTSLNLSAYIIGSTALDAAPDKKLRILSEIYLARQGVELLTGVEMDPGETGFVRHDVVSSVASDGNYLKIQNHFGNTGGTTKRVFEIPGHINETMRVDGYAEVWDTTEMYDGSHRAGFWNTMP